MTPEDFNTATHTQLQRIGAVHYFHPYAKEAAEGLGIDGFRFYVSGRAGVLGADVDTPVVLSAFGYFEPGVMHKMWTTSKERCDVREAALAQMGVAYRIGADALADVDGLAEATAAMAALTKAVDPAALPLFAAFAALDAPTNPAEAFMHHAIVMRELRGSVHLAALAATGVGSRVAHQIKRPDDLQMFGYTDALELSDADHASYALVEPMTDMAMNLHAEAITSDQRDQVSSVVHAASAALGL